MSNAELERLALLLEELGEVQKIVGKILRYGYESCHPFEDMVCSNRSRLEDELGDMLHAVELMYGKDINEESVHASTERKRVTVKPWLRYQG